MATDNTAPANFEPDGSLADAALMMPDLDGDMDDPSPSNTRTEIIDPREAANRRVEVRVITPLLRTADRG